MAEFVNVTSGDNVRSWFVSIIFFATPHMSVFYGILTTLVAVCVIRLPPRELEACLLAPPMSLLLMVVSLMFEVEHG